VLWWEKRFFARKQAQQGAHQQANQQRALAKEAA
jgi:hypothetical protein